MLTKIARTAVDRFRDARRLILFATLMAFAAGVVTYLRYDLTVHGIPLPLFTGLFYALFVGTAATFTSIILPALRTMIEAAAISRFGVSLAAYCLPDFALQLHHSPMLSATVVVGGAVVVRKLMATERLSRWSVVPG